MCFCSLLLLGGYGSIVSQVRIFFKWSASDNIYKYFDLEAGFPSVCSDLKTGCEEPAF